MKTFTVGDLEIDVLQHRRVDGSRFSTPNSDYIGDYFLIACRWLGTAINFYPNQGAPITFLAIGFLGLKVISIHQPFDPVTDTQLTQQEANDREELGLPVEYRPVGTKRVGDYRSHIFKTLARRIGKALRAQQLGTTVKGLTTADEVNAPVAIRTLLQGTFSDPIDLTTFSLDDAARYLRDAEGALEEGDPLSGTILAIDATFDSHATNGSAENETATVYNIGISSSTIYRTQVTFNLGGIPAGASINDADLQAQVSNILDAANGVLDILAYGTNGGGNPDTDTAADKYTNSGNGTVYVSGSALLGTLGSQTQDLGATADADIALRIGSTFSLGLKRQTESGTNDIAQIEGIENAGTDPMTLTVDYTTAGAGARDSILRGVTRGVGRGLR